jgi:hypothetical protein
MKQRIVAFTGLQHPAPIIREVAEGAIGQIGPIPTIAIKQVGVVELGGVAIRRERLDAAKPASRRRARGPGPGGPILYWEPDLLPEVIDMVAHFALRFAGRKKNPE